MHARARVRVPERTAEQHPSAAMSLRGSLFRSHQHREKVYARQRRQSQEARDQWPVHARERVRVPERTAEQHPSAAMSLRGSLFRSHQHRAKVYARQRRQSQEARDQWPAHARARVHVPERTAEQHPSAVMMQVPYLRSYAQKDRLRQRARRTALSSRKDHWPIYLREGYAVQKRPADVHPSFAYRNVQRIESPEKRAKARDKAVRQARRQGQKENWAPHERQKPAPPRYDRSVERALWYE